MHVLSFFKQEVVKSREAWSRKVGKQEEREDDDDVLQQKDYINEDNGLLEKKDDASDGATRKEKISTTKKSAFPETSYLLKVGGQKNKDTFDINVLLCVFRCLLFCETFQGGLEGGEHIIKDGKSLIIVKEVTEDN